MQLLLISTLFFTFFITTAIGGGSTLSSAIVEDVWQSAAADKLFCFKYKLMAGFETRMFYSGVEGADGKSGHHWVMIKLRDSLLVNGFAIFSTKGLVMWVNKKDKTSEIQCKDHCNCSYIQQFFDSSSWRLIGKIKETTAEYPGIVKLKKGEYYETKMLFLYQINPKEILMFDELYIFYADKQTTKDELVAAHAGKADEIASTRASEFYTSVIIKENKGSTGEMSRTTEDSSLLSTSGILIAVGTFVLILILCLAKLILHHRSKKSLKRLSFNNDVVDDDGAKTMNAANSENNSKEVIV